jgi:diacylglycerol kinase (ATP)
MTGGVPPDRRRRHRVIRNPAAGAKKGIAQASISREELVALLERHGIDARVIETANETETRLEARSAVRDGVEVVVAAGGDGTIGAVAEELLGSTSALGVLPLGSVMNIPRMLDLSTDLDEAAETLASGDVRCIDVGQANGQVFFEAASVGMNAAMFREANRFERGDWLSVLRTIWVALRYRPARMQLELDGDRMVRTRALMAVIANGPYTGLGMTVAPDARIDDGCFDVRVFRGFSKFELLRHLAGIAFGRWRYAPHVSTFRAATARVTSAHPLPTRADSHDLGTTPLEVRVHHAILRVVSAVPGSRPGR